MTLYPALSTKPTPSSSLPRIKEQNNPLPSIWDKLDLHHQRQVAQHLAQLIRRIRLQAHCLEANNEQS